MDLVPKEFSIDHMDALEEEAFYELILSRVNELLDHDIDLLLSHLYRLDVEEFKIRNALSLNAVLPANEGIARLILERQKKRWAYKKKYKQKPIEGWEF
jgi:hypothetical protein